MYIDLMTIPKFTLGAWARGAKLSFGTGEVIFFGVELATRDLKDQFPELAVDEAIFLLGYYYAPRQFPWGWVTLATYLGIYIDKFVKSRQTSESSESSESREESDD